MCFAFDVVLYSAGPVSYTHLDVYKRQVSPHSDSHIVNLYYLRLTVFVFTFTDTARERYRILLSLRHRY